VWPFRNDIILLLIISLFFLIGIRTLIRVNTYRSVRSPLLSLLLSMRLCCA